MKTQLKTLFFILAMVLLSQCEKDNPQVTIPDDNFLNALIELGVDKNGDGFVNLAEAEVITSLNVSKDSISSLTGIEAFVNLAQLDCSFNLLNSLNISHNIGIKYLRCENNRLTSLDISINTALTKFVLRLEPINHP
ncbi:MAG: hypothetical protein IIB05_10205 [Bacteroidetes bacterium]|nr:hypothetical protein [Bacteroidota bacterium]